MKSKKLWILLALLALICGICAILFRTNLVASEKVMIGPDTKAKAADKGVNPTDGETNRLREQIESLEATIAKLRDRITIGEIQTGLFTMPGLRGSLVGLPCVRIEIEDLPLDAVRYGLTKKNIREAIEAQFRSYNIKTFNYETSDFSDEEILWYYKTRNRPQLHIEVECSALKGGLYLGGVKVSMKQDGGESYPPDHFERIKRFDEEGISALEKSLIATLYATEWARTCVVFPGTGKLDNFAEDEKNALEELVGDFINDYLKANPKGFVTLIRGYVGTEDNPVIPWAVIRGQVVHQGDTVGGVKIFKIHKDEVEFEKDGKRWTQKEGDAPDPTWR